MEPTEKDRLQPLLDKKDLAKLLKLSISRVSYEVHKENIPFFKIGRSVRFKLSDIEQWIATKAHEPK